MSYDETGATPAATEPGHAAVTYDQAALELASYEAVTALSRCPYLAGRLPGFAPAD